MKKMFTIFFISFLFQLNNYAQWEEQTVSETGQNYNLNSVYFLNKNLGWAAGSDGVIIKTTNGGGSWEIQSGASFNINSVYFVDSLSGFAVAANTVLKTTDGGYNWDTSYVFLGPDAPSPPQYNSVYFTDKVTGWAAGAFWDEQCLNCPATPLLSHTTDGGASWIRSYIQGAPFKDAHGGEITDLFFLDKDAGWLTISANSTDYGTGNIFKTINGGQTWSSISPADSLLHLPSVEGVHIGFHTVDFATKNIGWVAGYEEYVPLYWGRVLKTVDGGQTWVDKTPVRDLNYIDLQFPDSLNGWTVGISDGSNFKSNIMKTEDGGNTWNNNYFNTLINSISFIDKYNGWAVGGGKIFKYTNVTPTITLQPFSQIVNEGQSVSFVVKAEADGPFGFQWWSNGQQLNTGDKNGRVTITNSSDSSVLTINNVNFIEDNNNTFLCEVKNLDGYPADGYWINSNTATLTVESPENWEILVNVSDTGNNQSSVSFGQSLIATDGIDTLLGESELPPPPPAGNFDIRFNLPTNVGSLKDIPQQFANRYNMGFKIPSGSIRLPN